MGGELMRAAKKNRTLSRRHLVAAGLGFVAVSALFGRIWWVNGNAFDYPECRYGTGEWVDLDGAFTIYANENTKGYSLCVQDAQVMTRAEYIARYALEPSQVELTDYDDVPSVLCVTLAMRNQGNDTGKIHLYNMSLMPEGEVRSMRYQTDLWATSNKNIGDATYSFRMLVDSEFTTHIPYILYGHYADDFRHEIRARRFSFVVSNAPVRNIIDFEA